MISSGFRYSRFFLVSAATLSWFLADPAWAFDLKSINNLNSIGAAAKPNVIIDRIGPAGIPKRLDAVLVLPEVYLSK